MENKHVDNATFDLTHGVISAVDLGVQKGSKGIRYTLTNFQVAAPLLDVSNSGANASL